MHNNNKINNNNHHQSNNYKQIKKLKIKFYQKKISKNLIIMEKLKNYNQFHYLVMEEMLFNRNNRMIKIYNIKILHSLIQLKNNNNYNNKRNNNKR